MKFANKPKLRRRRKGFTLVEALVAAVVTGAGVAAAMGALASLTRAEADLEIRQTLYMLASRKADELVATGQYQVASEGDFQPEGYPDLRWNASTEPTGVEQLEALTITSEQVQPKNLQMSVTVLVYEPDTTQQQTTGEEGPGGQGGGVGP